MSVAEDLKTMTPEQIANLKKDTLKAAERLKREVRREVDAEEREPVAPPDAITLRELLSRPRVQVPWRIAQLQAIGHRVLLAAQFKAGKTTMAANVARSVLDGEPFLNTYPTEAIDGALVLLDFEMSQTQLGDWYRDQHITNDDRLLVMPMRGAASAFNIVDPVVCREWAARLKARNAQYLILDCVRPVLDALGLNEHTEAGLFLTAFDALLRDAGISEAVVIQHMGHKNERARGDSRLLDWPDVGWTLVREGDDDPASPRFFKAYGRDVDVPETQLTFDPGTRRLSVVGAEAGGGSRAEAKVASALKDVCAFIAAADPAPSGRQVEDAVKVHGHTQKAIRKALREGLSRGLLVEGVGRNGGAAYRPSVGPKPEWIPSLVDADRVAGGQRG